MNTQARKLNLIEKLTLLNDNKVLEKIEKLLLSGTKNKMKPMGMEEFYERVEASEEAIKKGKTISQDDLEAESENW